MDRLDTFNLPTFIRRHPRLFVLTGAGCSTDSGIPDYRDAAGQWKRRQPVQHQDFLRSEHTRRRYWARSLLGWRHLVHARPNRAHTALAKLEKAGYVHQLVTQNIDGLHQQAGSQRVIDLHGRIDRVVCLDCGERYARSALQERLEAENPDLLGLSAQAAPDGDADLDNIDFSALRVPACNGCGGTLKPDVVFFGDNVPRERVDSAYRALGEADAVLVVGSSLMVYSGFRFCRRAAEAGKPMAAINLGRTRADDLLTFKVARPCGEALEELLEALALRD